jgi:hypothetical protein
MRFVVCLLDAMQEQAIFYNSLSRLSGQGVPRDVMWKVVASREVTRRPTSRIKSLILMSYGI